MSINATELHASGSFLSFLTKDGRELHSLDQIDKHETTLSVPDTNSLLLDLIAGKENVQIRFL